MEIVCVVCITKPLFVSVLVIHLPYDVYRDLFLVSHLTSWKFYQSLFDSPNTKHIPAPTGAGEFTSGSLNKRIYQWELNRARSPTIPRSQPRFVPLCKLVQISLTSSQSE